MPDEIVSKEFLSQFKTKAYVSNIPNRKTLKKRFEGKMDAHLRYEKNSLAGNNSGNS